MKSLQIPWTKGLQGKEKADFENLLRNSTQVLSRLKKLLIESRALIEKEELELSNYSEGWAYKQAFLNGRKKEIKYLETLLDFI